MKLLRKNTLQPNKNWLVIELRGGILLNFCALNAMRYFDEQT